MEATDPSRGDGPARVIAYHQRTMHRVDRSTISRWIARARQFVLAETRRQLAADGVAPEHFDSFIDVLRSNFELSLRRMLDG